MKVGIITIFPWRIHREQGLVLANFLQEEEHEVFRLECGGSKHQCFNKLLKNENSLIGCAKCRLATISHLEKSNESKFSDFQTTLGSLSFSEAREKVESSALSINRLEYSQETLSSLRGVIEELTPLVTEAYHATHEWVNKNQLDAVFVFNGRMDVLRGCFDAAQDLGVKLFSFERTWFGDGIQCLAAENCLGLKKINSDLREWKELALTEKQALKAGALISKRLQRAPNNEWRTYGKKINKHQKPREQFGILVLPSSVSETAGHPDWTIEWESQIQGFDEVIRKLALSPDEVVVRGHPVWAQKIGNYKAEAINREYSSWCSKNGFKYIDPVEDLDAIELIRASKIVLVSVSTAAVEASVLGKPVISICRSHFSEAGFTKNIFNKSDLGNLDKVNWPGSYDADSIAVNAKKALRFVYYMAFRLPILPNSLRLRNSNNYIYNDDSASSFITDIISSGTVPVADKDHNASNSAYEEKIIRRLMLSDQINAPKEKKSQIQISNFNKSNIVKFILLIRGFFKIGDR